MLRGRAACDHGMCAFDAHGGEECRGRTVGLELGAVATIGTTYRLAFGESDRTVQPYRGTYGAH